MFAKEAADSLDSEEEKEMEELFLDQPSDSDARSWAPSASKASKAGALYGLSVDEEDKKGSSDAQEEDENYEGSGSDGEEEEEEEEESEYESEEDSGDETEEEETDSDEDSNSEHV
eukprot:Colp12_sorted_trinity150504_noHs@36546